MGPAQPVSLGVLNAHLHFFLLGFPGGLWGQLSVWVLLRPVVQSGSDGWQSGTFSRLFWSGPGSEELSRNKLLRNYLSPLHYSVSQGIPLRGCLHSCQFANAKAHKARKIRLFSITEMSQTGRW